MAGRGTRAQLAVDTAWTPFGISRAIRATAAPLTGPEGADMVLGTLTLLVHAPVTGDFDRAMVALMSASRGTGAARAAGGPSVAAHPATTAWDSSR